MLARIGQTRSMPFPADRLAIDDLLARFVDAVARRSPEALRELFTADAVAEGPAEPPREGAAAIVAALVKGFEDWDVLVIVPHAHLVAIDGDTARVRWYLSEIGRRSGDDVVYAGVYHDELRRDIDRWCFARRRFDLLYACTPGGSLAQPFPSELDRPL
jgi:ketosteroid isomerase-like protein